MLDRFGFRRKQYAELLSDMDTKARELFGDDINTTERSPLGIIIRLYAWFLSKTWELAEKVYNSRFVSKAEGTQLDYLTPFFNTRRQSAQASVVPLLVVTGTPGHVVTDGTQYTTETDVYFAVTGDITIGPDGIGRGSAVAMEPGVHGNVAAGTITVQAEPSADVTSVTNPEPAEGGRDEETDLELRARLLDTASGAQGEATSDSIRAAVMEVPGVRSASVVVNNEITEVNGDAPKSIHVYALDGIREDVANAIYNTKAAGIGTNGAEVVEITDASGNTQSIRFDYATEVPVFAAVTLETNPSFPADGVDRVRNAIVRTVGGELNDGTRFAGLDMGEDVYLSRIIAAVMAVTGVVNADVTIGTDPAALAAQSIVVEPYEVAQTTFSNIEVTTV